MAKVSYYKKGVHSRSTSGFATLMFQNLGRATSGSHLTPMFSKDGQS